MDETLQKRTAFFLTGRIEGTGLEPLGEGMLPAVLARYGDLASLRYDLPLVLSDGRGGEPPLNSLSRLVDQAVASLGEAPDRDRIGRDGYAIEREIRRSEGESNDLAEAWDFAAERLLAERGEDLLDSSKRLRSAFPRGASVAFGGAELPAAAVRHLWNVASDSKASRFRFTSERLLMKLRDILAAERIGSAEGRAPAALMAGVGAGLAGAFDFESMSRMLTDSKPFSTLSDTRRDRIRDLIGTLEDQRFYAFGDGPEAYGFEFENCAAAVTAYSERHSEAVALVKALRIAELEAAGEYKEAVHDRIFEGFGESGLSAGDLALLPDYLVVLDESSLDGPETERLIDLLRTGLPVKVLVVTHDVVAASPYEEGHSAVVNGTSHLVDAAIGFSDVHVLRLAASQLAAEREAIQRSLSYEGASLIVAYSGVGRTSSTVPAFLSAAAGVESRAFTFLEYDPAAGGTRAARLRLDGNPARTADWVSHAISFEDEDLQAQTMDAAFTPAELMAMDGTFSGRFAVLPEDAESEGLVPLEEALEADWEGIPDAVPFIFLIDGENRLRVAITDYRTLLEVRRCLDVWRGLRDSAGTIAVVEEIKEEVAEIEAADAAAEAAPAAEAPEPAEAEREPGDPFIETERCTTCNECTQINDKMFAYNENKQAYIKDLEAGTFRQLVEAAESCQVGIIHPGKPRNPKEPGLEDLIKRAEDFQ